MMRLLRAQLGYQWVPSAVRFRHPAPADRSAYRRIFCLDVQFESDYDGIEFPSAALDQINSGADPAMMRYARQLVRREERRVGTEWAGTCTTWWRTYL